MKNILQLNENGNNIALDNTELNLGLIGKYDRIKSIPVNITLNDERQRAASKINITLLSDITSEVDIYVPYDVTPKLDSLKLSGYNYDFFAIYRNYVTDVETLTIDRSITCYFQKGCITHN